MKITKPQLRNRIRKMIREVVGETSTDVLSLTRKQNAVLHKIEKQYQILGSSGKNPVVLDLGAGAEVKIRIDGSQFWYLNGQLHRTDGPAEIWFDRTQFWWLNGQRHRADGPAVIYDDGSQFWYLNGQLHRTDGPAEIWYDGSQFWWLNGKLHREDGPAVFYPNGTQRWYLNGEKMTQKEHTQRTTSERM